MGNGCTLCTHKEVCRHIERFNKLLSDVADLNISYGTGAVVIASCDHYGAPSATKTPTDLNLSRKDVQL